MALCCGFSIFCLVHGQRADAHAEARQNTGIPRHLDSHNQPAGFRHELDLRVATGFHLRQLLKTGLREAMTSLAATARTLK